MARLAGIWLATALAVDRVHQVSTAALGADILQRVTDKLQPLLEDLGRTHNTSLSFGFATAEGTVSLAAGVNNPWIGEVLSPDTPIPLGSVTKTWTALRVMQFVEKGRIALSDKAADWIDPIIRRLYANGVDLPPVLRVANASLVGLWGAQADEITIGDLLSMQSGLADYNDTQIMEWTLAHGGDDMPPWAYIVSASREGFVCKPRSCGAYSGANYELLGFVLVNLEKVFSWQDLDQLKVIPTHLWEQGRYRHTTFPKLGRCSQYPGLAHQFAASRDPRYKLPRLFFTDLFKDSCLNGWTMGNLAASGGDLANFFYDIFALAPSGQGFVNESTLQTMMQWHGIKDDWCLGPRGPGSCKYGMGLFRDQIGQDIFPMAHLPSPLSDREAVRLDGHPGQDWGSTAGPCGYNKRYGFSMCLALTSTTGMNCSAPLISNAAFTADAICRVYDAVLATVGGPRLRCRPLPKHGPSVRCAWGNHTPGSRTRAPELQAGAGNVLGKYFLPQEWSSLSTDQALVDAPWASASAVVV